MLVKKIDIHVHTSWEDDMPRFNGSNYATPEELREMYDRMGIEFGVLLPGMSPEATFHYNTNGDCRRVARKYPDTVITPTRATESTIAGIFFAFFTFLFLGGSS